MIPLPHLLVPGGSGRTAIHLLQQATTRERRGRALVRGPEAVQDPADVELIKGTPANIDNLRKAAQESGIKASNLKAGFADHDGVDQAVRAAHVDWTPARAAALSDKPANGPVQAAEHGIGKPAMRISRADFAGLPIATVEQEAWIRQAPLVRNARG